MYRDVHRLKECRRNGVPFEICLRLLAVIWKRQRSAQADVVGEWCEASRGYRFDAGYDREFPLNFIDIIRLVLRIRVAAGRQVHVRAQRVPHVKARTNGVGIDKVSQKEKPRGEDDDRSRYLGDDKSTAQT